MTVRFQEACGFQYHCHRGTDPNGLCVYILGLPQEPTEIAQAYDGYPCSIVYIVISEWDDQLTPWPAKGLYRGDADFKGLAPEMLKTLERDLMPTIEQAEGIAPVKRAIAGYSLAGLFAIYAFANSDAFHDAASMSGSFWYEDWVSYLSGLKRDKQGSFVYLSLGLNERKAREKILHAVQENTDETARILQSWGAQVEKRYGPGGHFDFIQERVDAGLNALIAEQKGRSKSLISSFS